jgi:hypothetical protein
MTETVLGDRLFVGGEWVESSATGKTFDVVNPANGEVLATLPDGGEAEMRRAVAAREHRRPLPYVELHLGGVSTKRRLGQAHRARSAHFI